MCKLEMKLEFGFPLLLFTSMGGGERGRGREGTRHATSQSHCTTIVTDQMKGG